MIEPPASKSETASRFNPWYELSGLGAAVMEASWMTLLFQAVSDRAAAASTGWVFLYFAFVFYLAYQLARLFANARLASAPARALLLGGYLLLAWFGRHTILAGTGAPEFDPLKTALSGLGDVTRLIPAWIYLAATSLWLYLRGMGAAREGAGLFAVQRRFKFGILMFLLYSLLTFASVRELPGLGLFIIFLSATLLAMAAARAAVLGRLRGGRRSPFSRQWFWSLLGAVGGTVGLGLSLAMLATGRFALFYRQLLANLILAVITLTLAPFLFVLGALAGTPVESLPAPPPTPELPPWEDGGGLPLEFAQSGGDGSDLVPPDLRVFYFLGLAAAGLIVVLIFWRARVGARRRDRDDTVESIYRRADLLQELKEAFTRRGKKWMDELTGRAGLRQGQQVRAAARIRQIYAELIQLTAGFGAPRDPAQTPLEFIAALRSDWPAAAPQLESITQAYLKIRYGEYPEHVEEVRAVEAAWKSVQSSARERVKGYERRLKEEDRDRRRKERIG